MGESISDRLRSLRDRKAWTVADMAERTGIPKRTLDKYMLRQGASLPGFDALCSLSKGLGVSLDWLVFGAEGASKGVELIAYRACNAATQVFAETLVRHSLDGAEPVIKGERILNLKPEDWALYCADVAGKEAARMLSEGVTLEELLLWRQRQAERSAELFVEMVEELAPGVKLPPSQGLKLR